MKQNIENYKFRVFLVKFVRYLEPRRYHEHIFQEQFSEVHEVLYVNIGSVLIGYRLFNDTFYAKCMRGNQVVVGDFACYFNKVSEFLYKSHEMIQGFALKKQNFLELMEDKIGKNMICKIKKGY